MALDNLRTYGHRYYGDLGSTPLLGVDVPKYRLWSLIALLAISLVVACGPGWEWLGACLPELHWPAATARAWSRVPDLGKRSIAAAGRCAWSFLMLPGLLIGMIMIADAQFARVRLADVLIFVAVYPAFTTLFRHVFPPESTSSSQETSK